MRPAPLRLAASAAATALVAVLLTGCATGAGGGCAPLATSGPASEAVRVTGEFGTAPDVDVDGPLHVGSTQVSTVIAGSGAPLQAAQQVVADVTFLNATTGEVATASDYSGDGAAARFVIDQLPLPGLRKALVCAQVGERLAAVIPPDEGIPAESRPAAIGAQDSVVAVVDVRQAYLARADGVPQVMPGGLPSVVLGPDGRPGITLPESDPPTTLQVADLRTGSGSVLRAGDNAVLHYTAIIWAPDDAANDDILVSTWTDDAPRIRPLEEGQVEPGLLTALEGQRVGSQVLAVLPASEAYGDEGNEQVPPGATVVYVVDVLGKA